MYEEEFDEIVKIDDNYSLGIRDSTDTCFLESPWAGQLYFGNTQTNLFVAPTRENLIFQVEDYLNIVIVG